MGLFDTPEFTDSQLRKQEAGRKFKMHRDTLQALSILQFKSDHRIFRAAGITGTQINNLANAYRTEALLQSKTFTVCATCYQALKSRAPRKTAKNFSHFDCNLCNTVKPYSPFNGRESHYKIRHTTDLRTAQDYIRTNFPELFV